MSNGQSQYLRLPFGAVIAGHMPQLKIDEIFKEPFNVFGIMKDITIFTLFTLGCLWETYYLIIQ